MSDICRMCGLEFSSPSLGGPGICPACDCGINPEVTRLRARIANMENEKSFYTIDCDSSLRAENESLRTRVAELEKKIEELEKEHRSLRGHNKESDDA